MAVLAAGSVSVFDPVRGTVDLGPGTSPLMPMLDWLSQRTADSPLLQFLVQLCTPAVPQVDTVFQGIVVFSTMVAMWMMMSLAMMLPSAAPLIRTYCDIADTARGKGEPVITPLVLVAGYLSIWLVFSICAAAFQLGLISLGTIEDPVRPVQGWLAAAILIVAGLYQFSALKDACLEKCRNPFTTLFAKWTTSVSGVFRLGVQQGLFCLGCCWALMLVMLVIGTMNLVWMALFTLLAVLEKSGSGKVTSRLSGGILLGWGGILAISTAALTLV
ncbi:MAG: DUF2182 domain-containing protein [Pseudomonadota bacterium]